MPDPHLLLLAAPPAGLAGFLALERRSWVHHRPKGAEWATGRHLKPLTVKGPEKGRVILGKHDGRLIAAGDRASTLVMGPTQQSGKTSRVVIPAVLEWDGPAVCTSVKADVVDATIRRRQELGEVKVFEPRRDDTNTWSPIAAASDWTAAREIAAHLIGVGASRGDDEHWRQAAARHLAPLLLAANEGRRTLAALGRWIDTTDESEARRLLQRRNAQHALEVLESLERKDERYTSAVYATLETQLDVWMEPSIANATAAADITAEWLLSGSNTVFVIGGGHQQQRLQGLYGALLAALIDGALTIAADRPGGRLDPPLLCALDEVANIAHVQNLDRYASAGLAPGVILLTVLQDYSQAAQKWGAERAQTILSNHTAKLFCSGIGDSATLRWIGELLGHERVMQRSEHHSNAATSVTTADHLEPLAPPHRIREGDADQALLIAGRIPPAWIDMRPWYADKKLRRLADGE